MIDKKSFIEFMLESEVLRFGEFTTKSGRLSPYFVNTGNYKTGKQISTLGRYYAQLVKETLTADDFDALFGPAYKGIPLASAAASKLYEDYGIDKPYFFNRKEAKDHGEGGNVIGYKPTDGDRIIIIEDVITAGTAVRETMPLLKALADCKVNDMFISVNRMEKGTGETTATEEIYNEYGIKVHSIINAKDILEYLEGSELYAQYCPKMREYMTKYCK